MRSIRCTFAVLALMIGLCASAFPQASLTATYLSAAVTSTSVGTIIVNSATGFTVNYMLYVDKEAMLIEAIDGTVVTVMRGASGSMATVHAIYATVLMGKANYFSSADRFGPCTAANELVLPVVNVTNGKIFTCVDSAWKMVKGPDTKTAPNQVSNIPLGPIALGASLGTSTATVSGTLYTTELWIPSDFYATGLKVLYGAATNTDSMIVVLHDSNANVVAYSALAGAAKTGTAYTFYSFAFTTPVFLPGPGKYYASVQTNGTGVLQLIAASTYLNFAKSTTGTFGTIPTLTVPTSTIAVTGPIVVLY